MILLSQNETYLPAKLNQVDIPQYQRKKIRTAIPLLRQFSCAIRQRHILTFQENAATCRCFGVTVELAC